MNKRHFAGLLKKIFLLTALILLSNERTQAEEVNLNVKFVGKNVLVKGGADVTAYLVSSTANPFCIKYGINKYIGGPYMNNLKETSLKITPLSENVYNISGAVDSGGCFYSISKIWLRFENIETKQGNFDLVVSLYNWEPDRNRNYFMDFSDKNQKGYYRFQSGNKIDSKCFVGSSHSRGPRVNLFCTSYGYSSSVKAPMRGFQANETSFSIEAYDNSFVGSECEIGIDDSLMRKEEGKYR